MTIYKGKINQPIFYKISLMISFLSITNYGNSQTIQNVLFKQQDKSIEINYDLAGNPNNTFEVKAYISEDNGITWSNPLVEVRGDVGLHVYPGKNRKIFWDVLSERESLTGSPIFKVTAELMENKPIRKEKIYTDPRDREEYAWLIIGKQTWLGENLRYRTDTGSWVYNETNAHSLGRLYDWETAQKVCPEGWRLPTDNEWEELMVFLGGEGVAGGKMKDDGFDNWNYPNKGATNESGFNVLPGGYRGYDGAFHNMFGKAFFWSSTEMNTNSAWIRVLSKDNKKMQKIYFNKQNGLSVRCIKDI